MEDHEDDEDGGDQPSQEIRTYKKRWLVLILFSMFSLVSAYQWIHLPIISNLVLRYYNSSLPHDPLRKATAVDWLSMVYFLAYMVSFLPVLWILDSKVSFGRG